MFRRVFSGLTVALLGAAAFASTTSVAEAKEPPLPRHYYYPYYYFPHNYWPTLSPKYPEQYGAPYMKPPGYMAYPPFLEPNWRYELWNPLKHYRGNHFWLDQF